MQPVPSSSPVFVRKLHDKVMHRQSRITVNYMLACCQLLQLVRYTSYSQHQDHYCNTCSDDVACCGPAGPAEANCAGDWPAFLTIPSHTHSQNMNPPHCRDCVDPVEWCVEIRWLLRGWHVLKYVSLTVQRFCEHITLIHVISAILTIGIS